MAEYIDREKAVRRIRDVTLNIRFKDTREAIDTCIAVLDCEPSAVDAVPVVRCRECKHCDPENHHCDHHMGTAAPLRRKPNDFCSYGERKEVADNPTIKNEMEAKEE